MVFQKRVIVDARGHLLGRLASVVAKELLNGQRVVIVRAEEVLISGTFIRNKLKYLSFLKKSVNTNPRRGPFHLRAPAKMVWRAIRGMLPHKSPRGAEALGRLKVFEGVPPPYDKLKRVVVPDALAIVRLRPGRKTTLLGRLSGEIGWKHAATVEKLEAKRKVRSAAFYNRKKALLKIKAKAAASVQSKLPATEQAVLTKFGF